jgi:hypothetical protein
MDMDTRMDKMEADLTALIINVAVIKANYVTRQDLAEAKHSIVTWVVGAILLVQLLPPILRKFGI